MTKDELIRGALAQLGVVSRPAVAWHSPFFGHRSGTALLAPGDGWILVALADPPRSWVWVHACRLHGSDGRLRE